MGDELRQLWLQYPSVSSDKAAFRQPRQRRIVRVRPWSARPRLRCVPTRLSADARRLQLEQIEEFCTKTLAGCWIYPRVRDFAYPYLTIRGDDGSEEQWSARRYVWALVHGDIPEGGIIIGECPAKACVLPDHQSLWVPPKQFSLALELGPSGEYLAPAARGAHKTGPARTGDAHDSIAEPA